MSIGTGGEGYIAEDAWCYNCAQCGHWGDVRLLFQSAFVASTFVQDCEQPRLAEKNPGGPSAFSAYNTMSGPFFDPAEKPPGRSQRRSDRERDDSLPDGWGKSAPIDVGKRGRHKAMARLERQASALDQDEDDWFVNRRDLDSPPRRNGAPPSRGSNLPSKKELNFSFKSDPRLLQDSTSTQSRNQSRPTLLDRIEGHGTHGARQADSRTRRDREPDHYNSRRSRDHEPRERRHDGRSQSDRYGDRDRRVNSRRNESGPRYRGGYDR